jgi:hypothetical protein
MHCTVQVKKFKKYKFQDHYYSSLFEQLKIINMQSRTLESFNFYFLNVFTCNTNSILISFNFCRNYKREAELARMAWKIKPEDLLPTHLGAKGQFGSRYSLGRISLPVMKIKDVG